MTLRNVKLKQAKRYIIVLLMVVVAPLYGMSGKGATHKPSTTAVTRRLSATLFTVVEDAKNKRKDIHESMCST